MKKFFLMNLVSMFIVVALILMLEFLFCSTHLIMDFELFSFVESSFNFIILLDYFSVIFLWAVLIISSSVFIFSSSYMMTEKFYHRFHFLLFSFVFSMIMLILSPNLVSILLGWDGLGISSYLLVMYYSSSKSFNAGMITFASNRVGDALIIISISSFVYMANMNTPMMFYLFSVDHYWVLIIMMIAACTKSAQIPFSAWLPAAMAAPTPVSSLVHSSTLVTAGVYLIFRFDCALIYFNINMILLLLGTLTMLMASVSAFFEMDMKKMVALSTLSQLGVMMVAMGAGFSVLGFFHLLSHAFFKALLFISAGNIIHNSDSYQDLRVMGGMTEIMPFTKSMIIGCSLSLCGLPFMSAFYSKEMIIESLLMYNLSFIPYIFMMLGILMTVFYSSRFLIISISWVSRQRSLFNKSDLDYTTNYSMMILFFPAVMGGGIISGYMKFKFLFLVSSLLKLTALWLVLLGMVFFFFFFKMSLLNYSFNLWGLSSLWALPFISSRVPVFIFTNSGDYLHKLVDFSWSYFILVNLCGWPLLAGSSTLILFQNMSFMRIFSNMIIITMLTLMFI